MKMKFMNMKHLSTSSLGSSVNDGIVTQFFRVLNAVL